MKLYKIVLLITLISTRAFAIENLKDKSWSGAFDIVHSKVKYNYPFTEHKRINLDSLYHITSEAIQKAEQTKNDTAYFLAIKKYAFALNDNHVFAKKKEFDAFTKELAGHYGFEIEAFDNGDVVISQIRKGANGLSKHVKVGNKITSWNNTPVKQAISCTSLLLGERMDATAQNRFLQQCKLLMFAPLGEFAIITIENEHGASVQVTLKPFPSKDLKKAWRYPKVTLWDRAVESPVDFDIFEEDSIGYFRINGFMPNFNDLSLAQTFRDKLWLLKRLKIKSLIIDVRGNQGGVDKWAMKMAGHFVNEPKHYQYVSKYSEETGEFEINSSLTNTVTPRKPYFNEQVLILVDNQTASTGEGLPMALQSLPNVKVVGQYGTAGAFATGFADFIFKMPEDVVFGFLEGRSLDENGNIQVDADYRGIGGIIPDVKVPVTQESVKAQNVDSKDYVLDFAQNYLTKTKYTQR